MFSEAQEENDFPFIEHLSRLPYFKNKARAMATKWAGVQRLLRDRENQLEMSLGNMVLFLEGVDEFLLWVQNQRGLDCISLPPSADMAELQADQEAINKLKEAMNLKDSTRLALLRSAENLRGQLSGESVETVRESVEKMEGEWRDLSSVTEEKLNGERTVIVAGFCSKEEWGGGKYPVP